MMRAVLLLLAATAAAVAVAPPGSRAADVLDMPPIRYDPAVEHTYMYVCLGRAVDVLVTQERRKSSCAAAALAAAGICARRVCSAAAALLHATALAAPSFAFAGGG